MTASNESHLVEGLADIQTLFLTCLLLLYTTHISYMLCIVAIVDCPHEHYVVHCKIIRTHHISCHVGLANASFKVLVNCTGKHCSRLLGTR